MRLVPRIYSLNIAQRFHGIPSLQIYFVRGELVHSEEKTQQRMQLEEKIQEQVYACLQ